MLYVQDMDADFHTMQRAEGISMNSSKNLCAVCRPQKVLFLSSRHSIYLNEFLDSTHLQYMQARCSE